MTNNYGYTYIKLNNFKYLTSSIQQAFIDKNKDGVISKEEAEAAKGAIDAGSILDSNGDGQVDYDELKKLDNNNDGLISQEEFKNGITDDIKYAIYIKAYNAAKSKNPPATDEEAYKAGKAAVDKAVAADIDTTVNDLWSIYLTQFSKKKEGEDNWKFDPNQGFHDYQQDAYSPKVKVLEIAQSNQDYYNGSVVGNIKQWTTYGKLSKADFKMVLKLEIYKLQSSDAQIPDIPDSTLDAVFNKLLSLSSGTDYIDAKQLAALFALADMDRDAYANSAGYSPKVDFMDGKITHEDLVDVCRYLAKGSQEYMDNLDNLYNYTLSVTPTVIATDLGESPITQQQNQIAQVEQEAASDKESIKSERSRIEEQIKSQIADYQAQIDKMKGSIAQIINSLTADEITALYNWFKDKPQEAANLTLEDIKNISTWFKNKPDAYDKFTYDQLNDLVQLYNEKPDELTSGTFTLAEIKDINSHITDENHLKTNYGNRFRSDDALLEAADSVSKWYSQILGKLPADLKEDDKLEEKLNNLATWMSTKPDVVANDTIYSKMGNFAEWYTNGINGHAKPSKADTLTDQDFADIVAYVTNDYGKKIEYLESLIAQLKTNLSDSINDLFEKQYTTGNERSTLDNAFQKAIEEYNLIMLKQGKEDTTFANSDKLKNLKTGLSKLFSDHFKSKTFESNGQLITDIKNIKASAEELIKAYPDAADLIKTIIKNQINALISQIQSNMKDDLNDQIEAKNKKIAEYNELMNNPDTPLLAEKDAQGNVTKQGFDTLSAAISSVKAEIAALQAQYDDAVKNIGKEVSQALGEIMSL